MSDHSMATVRRVSPSRDADTLSALVSFNRESGDFASALKYAEQLAKASPANAELTNLIETLRREAAKSAP